MKSEPNLIQSMDRCFDKSHEAHIDRPILDPGQLMCKYMRFQCNQDNFVSTHQQKNVQGNLDQKFFVGHI